MTKINTNPREFTPEKAREYVDQLNSGEDQSAPDKWNYLVYDTAFGYSHISAYDEHDVFLGWM